MAHRKNTIKIDGEKLKSLLEKKTGLTLYEISENSGYSRKLLNQACATGYASSTVQNVVRLYGIPPEDYRLKKSFQEVVKESRTEPDKGEQMSFNDLVFVNAEDVKNAVKEGVIEALNDIFPVIVEKIVEEIREVNIEKIEEVHNGR